MPVFSTRSPLPSATLPCPTDGRGVARTTGNGKDNGGGQVSLSSFQSNAQTPPETRAGVQREVLSVAPGAHDPPSGTPTVTRPLQLGGCRWKVRRRTLRSGLG